MQGEVVQTKKFEYTEGCRRWRKLTQTETNSQWKLWTEIEEVSVNYGVEGIKAVVDHNSGPRTRKRRRYV